MTHGEKRGHFMQQESSLDGFGEHGPLDHGLRSYEDLSENVVREAVHRR
jgi:hypothetical protein